MWLIHPNLQESYGHYSAPMITVTTNLLIHNKSDSLQYISAIVYQNTVKFTTFSQASWTAGCSVYKTSINR